MWEETIWAKALVDFRVPTHWKSRSWRRREGASMGGRETHLGLHLFQDGSNKPEQPKLYFGYDFAEGVEGGAKKRS
jgi:hypothetical protein